MGPSVPTATRQGLGTEMLYEVTHHTYSPSTGHDVGLVCTVGTKRAAELLAEHLLREAGRIYTTNDCYHRDLGRAGSVRVRERKSRRFLAQYDPSDFDGLVHIVPSVGELGWTP
jgi:hypothetical protein